MRDERIRVAVIAFQVLVPMVLIIQHLGPPGTYATLSDAARPVREPPRRQQATLRINDLSSSIYGPMTDNRNRHHFHGVIRTARGAGA